MTFTNKNIYFIAEEISLGIMADTDKSIGNGDESAGDGDELSRYIEVLIQSKRSYAMMVNAREQADNAAEPAGNAYDELVDDDDDIPELLEGYDIPQLVAGYHDEVTSAQWRKEWNILGG